MPKRTLARAIHRALRASAVPAAIALGGLAANAAAQTATQASPPAAPAAQPQTLQTIVVTGSHIRRVDLETSNPVIAITAQQIAATGKLTLGDVIQDIPAITGGLTNPHVNNGGGSGATSVGLRGLGPSRTLVLVDGQRVVGFDTNGGSSGTGNAVDLNSIPAAAVERIEVLTDGASAVYGSDAIGGVINVILKSNYQGAQASLDYGVSSHGDGARRGAGFMFGQTSDRGSILAGADYNKFGEVLQSQRKFSENALSLETRSTTAGGFNVPGAEIGGSTFAARDKIVIPAALAACGPGGAYSLNPAAASAGTSPTATSDYHCFSTALGDKYNFASVNLLQAPQERTTGFLKGVYHLTDNVDAFATFWHTETRSGFQLAPGVFGTDTGISIAANSYFNPFGVPFTPTNGNEYRARLFPAGDRAASLNSSNDQIQAGLRGSFGLFGHDWAWTLGYDYGHIALSNAFRGLVNQAVVQQGLGPSFLNASGSVQCGTASAPIPLSQCTPWDPFNLYSASAGQVLSAAASPSLTESWYITRTEHADANGGLFDLPAGTVQLAAGVSRNSQYTNNTVGPLLLASGPPLYNCTLGSMCSGHTQGGYSVREAYAEMFIPVVKDMPYIGSLNVTLGDRYSRYSDVGSTSNWKIGVEWRPIDDLLVRGTVASVFRAPTINNIFSPPISSAPLLTSDPCQFTAPAGNANAPNPHAGNPACAGVPATGTFIDQDVQNAQQITAVTSGASFAGLHLQPEHGKTFDVGAVYSPRFLPQFSASVDVWRVFLNDTINTVGAQTLLNLCFAGITQYCPLFERFTSGALQGQPELAILPTANLGRIDVRGIDVSGSYKLPRLPFGQFTAGVQATYLQEYKIQTAPGEPGNQIFNAVGVMGSNGSALEGACPFNAGAVCFFPRIRAHGTLGWALGPWNAQWTMSYISPFKVGSADPSQSLTAFAGDPGYVLHFGSTVYNNLQAGYDIRPLDTRVDLGVDNVFGKQPPLIYANNALNANTDPNDFDVIGRFYWARLTVRF